MSNTIKYLGVGILGGMIPFAFSYFMGTPQPTSSISDQVIDGNKFAKSVSYNGLPVETTSFVEASESTINSVVHVTTKVVRT